MRYLLLVFLILCSKSVWASSENVDVYETLGKGLHRSHTADASTQEVDPFSGSLRLSSVDILIPGNGGMDIQLHRSYNSFTWYNADETTKPVNKFVALNPSVGENMLGNGWVMHFGKVTVPPGVSTCATKGMLFESDDGFKRELHPESNTNFQVFYTTDRWKAECSTDGKILTLRSPDGREYTMSLRHFELSVQLTCSEAPEFCRMVFLTTQIKDKNSNFIDVLYKVIGNHAQSYVSLDRVQGRKGSVADGRELVFKKDGARGVWTVTATMPNSVTRQISYFASGISNESNGLFSRLSQVQLPEGLNWRYDYQESALSASSAGKFNISRITYPQGGTIDVAYKWHYPMVNANLKQSYVASLTKNNTQSMIVLTYDYTATSSYDETVVNYVGAKHVYRYWGYKAAYYNNVSGRAGKIGALLEKQTYTAASSSNPAYKEAYSWGVQAISNTQAFLPGSNFVLENSVYAPILNSKTVQMLSGPGASSYNTFLTLYTNHDAYGNPQTIQETGTHTKYRNLSYYTNTSPWIIRQLQTESIQNFGVISGRTFDGVGNITSETNFGVQSNYQYVFPDQSTTGDPSGMTQSVRGQSIGKTMMQYRAGVPQLEILAEGVAINRIVDSYGNTTSQENPETKQSSGYGYDTLGRFTVATSPVEAVASKTKNAVNVAWLPTKRSLTRGNFKEELYQGGLGQSIASVHTDLSSNESISYQYQYDALGRKIFASYANSTAGTSYAYDALDRLTKITHPDGSFKTIEDYGTYTVVTNERGKVWRYHYRVYGDLGLRELVRIEPPDSAATIVIERDLVGQTTSVTQGGIGRTYEYFPGTKFLKSVYDPERGITNFTVDEIGNVLTETTNGIVLTYGYDRLHRLKSVTYSDSTPAVSYQYYADGKIKSISNSTALRQYEYDLTRNLTSESLQVDGYTFRLANDYNANEQLLSQTYPINNRVMTYSPDAFGRSRAVEASCK
jgi:YD repeat-containing protein